MIVRKSIRLWALVVMMLTVIAITVAAENNKNTIASENTKPEFNEAVISKIFKESQLEFSLDKYLESNENKKISDNIILILESLSFEKCVLNKYEPTLHDLSEPDDIKVLLGEPDYETENVLFYPNYLLMFAIYNGKLTNIATVSFDDNGERINTKEIIVTLNLQQIRDEIEKREQEEKEFRIKRDVILDSDDELYKLSELSPDEIHGLIGNADDIGYISSFRSKSIYITDERRVSMEIIYDRVKIITRKDFSTGESKIVYLDTDDLKYCTIYITESAYKSYLKNKGQE